MRYLLVKEDEKVGIVLFLAGFNKEEEVFRQLSYLLLDEALGEYAVETQVGFIELLPRESEYFSRALPLADLSADFDRYFSK